LVEGLVLGNDRCYRYRMRASCKHCFKSFNPLRSGAQYCSSRCRVAAHRQRHVPPAVTSWHGRTTKLRMVSHRLNSDGKPALARGELAEKLLDIAANDDDGQPKTGRRYYYLALSHGYIQPDMGDSEQAKKSREAAYDTITEILGVLRKSGRLDWEMVLDLTRELDQWEMFGSPREARAAVRKSYDEDRWVGQPYYPILIVEKDTMEPVCKPMADRWQMPFASSRGYASLKLQYDVARLLRERHTRQGQHAIVYFISDLDPSGLDLQRAWREALMDFYVPVANFVRIGLTREQVDALDNPILRQGIQVKPSDSRAEKFIEQYGDRCWETDILPAAVIEETINSHIRMWLDAKRWRRRDREIEAARALL
jgi:hypothetical protein